MASKNKNIRVALTLLLLFLSCAPQGVQKPGQLDAADTAIVGSLSAGAGLVGGSIIVSYLVAKPALVLPAGDYVLPPVNPDDYYSPPPSPSRSVSESLDEDILGDSDEEQFFTPPPPSCGLPRLAFQRNFQLAQTCPSPLSEFDPEELGKVADDDSVAAAVTEAMETTATLPDEGVFFSSVELGEEVEGIDGVVELLAAIFL